MNPYRENKLTKKKEWLALKNHFNSLKKYHLKDFFNQDSQRVQNFSLETKNIYFDYSKNIITNKTINFLIKLAQASNLEAEIEKMFEGKKINQTEKRAVLHTALRNRGNQPIFVDKVDVRPAIDKNLLKMKSIAEKIRSKKWLGFSSKSIKNIVHLGIGGSHLGPQMVTQALKKFSSKNINIYFVSNVDGTQLTEVLNKLKQEETLFIIASKTFTTQETMTNAKTAQKWLLEKTNSLSKIKNHFLAITSNEKLALQFRIKKNNILPLWDWVGGRYSLASSIGLPIMISVGYEKFINLLEGLFEIDSHFRNKKFHENIPILMALLGIWYNNFFKAETYAILPYSYELNLFPSYLQQVDMESNGKEVDKNGDLVDYETGPIIWGASGTDSQHSFFQLLHQGTKLIPVDFIAFVNPNNNLLDHQEKLVANFLAQSEALAFGDDSQKIPFKKFRGNKPSNSIFFSHLTPHTLGNLIALYEHKIFVQGIIWNIYSFDQWGVELGKNIAKKILKDLKNDKKSCYTYFNNSTKKLIDFYKSKYQESKNEPNKKTYS